MMKTKMMVIGMFCGRWVQYLYQLWPTPRPSVQQPILLKLPFSCSLQKLFSPSKNYSAHLGDVAGSKARLCQALTPLLQACLHIEQEWNISYTVLNWTSKFNHNKLISLFLQIEKESKPNICFKGDSVWDESSHSSSFSIRLIFILLYKAHAWRLMMM